MIKKYIRVAVIAGVNFSLLCGMMSVSFTLGNTSLADKSKLKIGYVESEPFNEFAFQLSGMAIAFQEFGILDAYNVDITQEDARVVWNEICSYVSSEKSGQYQFVESMFYSMKDMSEADYPKMVNNPEVDLVIVMGTAAGKYFTDNETKNKFMVLAAADPIAAGIVESETERSNDNSYAHIDIKRYKRQIQASYKLLNFKKVGVVYEDSAAAYVYSGIDQLKAASAELEFEIITRHVNEALNEGDYDRYYADLIKAYKELADEGIDVLYITTATIEDSKLLYLLEQDIYPHEIATIAQTSENQVKYGALIGVTIQDPKEQGYFAASQIKAYAEGTPFNKLEQVNEGTPKIYLNYDIAQQIGVRIPFSTLLTVDTIYRGKGSNTTSSDQVSGGKSSGSSSASSGTNSSTDSSTDSSGSTGSSDSIFSTSSSSGGSSSQPSSSSGSIFD